MAGQTPHVRMFTLADVRAATNNFSTRIGTGSFGEVFRGELRIDGAVAPVAVKRLRDVQQPTDLLSELQRWATVRGDCLLPLLGVVR